MKQGPLIIDVAGTTLTEEDRDVIRNPFVAGVILFTRNYESKAQLQLLIQDIRASRPEPLLIVVDQEGGRVQRFRDQFSLLPDMGSIGEIYNTDPQEGRLLAQECGWLVATELLSVGVDLNLAPVLDIDWGDSAVIGNRSFHYNPDVATELAQAFIQGQQEAGMNSVGKHFPGHGKVKEDSHHALPVDDRSLHSIQANDLIPYSELINRRSLDVIMTAHIIYPQVAKEPVTFSKTWLQTILRQQLNFNGYIMSDDLSMAGASHYLGGVVSRVEKAIEAGCDLILLCNDRAAVLETLAASSNIALPDTTNTAQPQAALTPLVVSDATRDLAKQAVQAKLWQNRQHKFAQLHQQGQELIK